MGCSKNTKDSVSEPVDSRSWVVRVIHKVSLTFLILLLVFSCVLWANWGSFKNWALDTGDDTRNVQQILQDDSVGRLDSNRVITEDNSAKSEKISGDVLRDIARDSLVDQSSKDEYQDYDEYNGYNTDGSLKPGYIYSKDIGLAIPWVSSATTYYNEDYDLMNIPPSYEAGWLNNTQPLGSKKGITLFAGHVNYYGTVLAPMSRIYNSQIGDIITITDENGKVYKYQVKSVQNVPQTQMSDMLKVYTSSEEDNKLVLLTCTEPNIYNVANGIYTENKALTATPIS